LLAGGLTVCLLLWLGAATVLSWTRPSPDGTNPDVASSAAGDRVAETLPRSETLGWRAIQEGASRERSPEREKDVTALCGKALTIVDDSDCSFESRKSAFAAEGAARGALEAAVRILKADDRCSEPPATSETRSEDLNGSSLAAGAGSGASHPSLSLQALECLAYGGSSGS
jgi:hypothetical protein